MQIEKESLPEFQSGTASVTTAAAQIQSASLPLRKGVYLQVPSGGGDISVGINGVCAATGFVVPAGTISPMLYVDDLNKLWVKSSSGVVAVTWMAF